MPIYPELTDKCREALVAGVEDPHGYLPPDTSGAVLGRLYKLGFAERGAITYAGAKWVEANRLPEDAPTSEATRIELLEAAIAKAVSADPGNAEQALDELRERWSELACGDWPAPCNCDDPWNHGGHR